MSVLLVNKMGKKHLLIVEDNDVNLKLYTYVLRGIDVEISIAKTGKEALDKIYSLKPDVVILDIQIPEINGIEVARQVRAKPEFNSLQIVAVTAYSMTGDKEKILQAGCNYYISKPIDTRAFPVIVKKLINGESPDL